jgi:ubiquinone/menaquinone biosynthesis C-methylase UbiE
MCGDSSFRLQIAYILYEKNDKGKTMKLDIENTKAEYSIEAVVNEVISFSEEVGLWQSERIIFAKYLQPHNKILDIGCGTGRTTFGLYGMGYKDILGLDLSEEMISAAQKIANDKSLEISFAIENACALSFNTDSFDAAVFSFNGIMTIPAKETRQKSFNEIYRVLKPGGLFIFTTHDINTSQYIDYWNEERNKWEKGEQDKRLLEYGDLIYSEPDASSGIVCFVHIPVDGEVEEYIKESGFNLLYKELRSNISEENKKVMENSADCYFWVVKK